MIKFMYNGVKEDKTLYKASYSLLMSSKFPDGTITIYARDYKHLPAIEGLTVENDSDIMTDYFDKDRIRVTPDNQWYSQVLEAYNKQQVKRGAETFYPVPAVPVKESAPNVVMFEPDGQASSRQLWALHCITKLDTRGWQLTKSEASLLIGKAKKGINILQFVGQIEKAAR